MELTQLRTWEKLRKLLKFTVFIKLFPKITEINKQCWEERAGATLSINHLIRLLASKPESSARAASALNHLVTTFASIMWFCPKDNIPLFWNPSLLNWTFGINSKPLIIPILFISYILLLFQNPTGMGIFLRFKLLAIHSSEYFIYYLLSGFITVSMQMILSTWGSLSSQGLCPINCHLFHLQSNAWPWIFSLADVC